MLGEGRGVQDVFAVEAELLRSEGIDPAWPGFDEDALLTRDSDASQ